MPSSPPVGPVTPGSEPNKIERPRPEDVKASTLAETILQQGFYSEKEIPLETQKEILKAHDTSLFYQMKVVLKVLGARISNTIGFIFSKSPITKTLTKDDVKEFLIAEGGGSWWSRIRS